jgi:hypothetical protein
MAVAVAGTGAAAASGGLALGGVVTIVLGGLISWIGYLTFSGRWTLLVTSRHFPPMPWYFGFLGVFAGPALLVGGLGEVLIATPWAAAHYAGAVLFLAGCAGLLTGIAFGFYLPRRLRPRWFTEYVSGTSARASQRRQARRQAERGAKLARELDQERASGQPPPGRPVRLTHHLGLSNTRSSEQEARDISGVSKPRLLVNGRICGPLPYATKVSEVPRKGALWVVPGRILFVQSAEDDRRLDESYFVEIPADKLYGMRPGRSDQGHSALELDVDRGVLAFEFDGDVESLMRDVREVLGA